MKKMTAIVITTMAVTSVTVGALTVNAGVLDSVKATTVAIVTPCKTPDTTCIPVLQLPDIGKDMDGKSVTLKIGQIVNIVLDSNASTGYSWDIAQTTDVATATILGPEYKNPDKPIPGKAGTDTFKLIAVHPGSSSLKLQYVRPWEKNQPAKTFSLTVEVQ